MRKSPVSNRIVLERPVGQVVGRVEHPGALFGGIKGQVRAARKFLAANRNDKPFADREGAIDKAAKAVRVDGPPEMTVDNIVRFMSPRPWAWTNAMAERGIQIDFDGGSIFHEDIYTIPPVEAPTAGSVLTQMEERNSGIITTDGKDTIGVVDKAEPIIVAIAVLRKLGFDANMAYAIARDREGNEMRDLMIALTSEERALPLVTMPLGYHFPEEPVGIHPVTHEVEILSDQAVYAITVALKAEIMTRRIMLDMATRAVAKETPIDEQMVNDILSVGDTLAEATVEWRGPFCPWVVDVTTNLFMRHRNLMLELIMMDASENAGEAVPLVPAFAKTAIRNAMELTTPVVNRIAELGHEKLARVCFEIIQNSAMDGM